MEDKLNESWIPGKKFTPDQTEGKISGKETSGEIVSMPEVDTIDGKEGVLNTRSKRIAYSTKEKGLKSLPISFGDSDGDWRIIESDNLFEVLYLDHNQFNLLSPEITENNYSLISSFWKEKKSLWESGNSQVRKSIEDKYSEKNINSCLKKLDNAIQQLSTTENINIYYVKLREQRIRKGTGILMNSMQSMMVDEIANKSEIQLCFNHGLKNDLSGEEIAIIIKNAFDKQGFTPYGKISGSTLYEQLFSVEDWMTEKKIEEAKNLEKERESLRIQILPGKYAKSIEDIGTILFEDPKESKEIIKEDLLKQVIAQKDLVLARDISIISKSSKNIDIAYLKIVYRLNRKLPFRFTSSKLVNTIEELCTVIFEDEQTIKLGREFFKNGSIETWLELTDIESHKKLIDIRDSNSDFEIAFLDLLYTFNPLLPYRFAEKYIVKEPFELAHEIVKSKENWKAGKTELFNYSILLWLEKTNRQDLVDKWKKIEELYTRSHNCGLEEFLHIMDDKLEYPNIHCNKTTISFPRIQSGKVEASEFILFNKTRGFASAEISFKKNIEGVSLSSKKIDFNSAESLKDSKILVKIDTTNLSKGISYETVIIVNVSNKQKIEIPVSFTLVFPMKAFVMESLKYMAIFSGIFMLYRLIITASYPDWLSASFNYFLDWDSALYHSDKFAVFGWLLLMFLIMAFIGVLLMIKYPIRSKS